MTPALSDQQLAILDLERARYRHQGVKEAEIRARLGLSPTRYHQLLGALLDHPGAIATAPALVYRLRRLRAARRAARSASAW